MSSECPKWTYSLPLSIFRNISEMRVTTIEHKWEATGADTSRDWIVFKGQQGSIDIDNPAVWDLFKFSPSYNGLIKLTNKGEQALQLSNEIKQYMKKHNSELATYLRLKKKFEGLENVRDV